MSNAHIDALQKARHEAHANMLGYAREAKQHETTAELSRAGEATAKAAILAIEKALGQLGADVSVSWANG